MGRMLRPDYAQRFLLPPSLDDWVPADHPARFVRDFVDSVDLAKVGIREPVAEEGRPPYAPDLLLKVWLFGYMERIRSTRGLEKACLQVMPFLWLTGNLHPDHNTLSRFFNTHRKVLPKLFKQLVKTAAEAELVGFVLHALDGTKLTAASSTDTAHHRKGLEEKLKRLDEFIAAYMQEVTTRAAEEDKGKGYTMPPAMADGDARRARIRALLDQRIEDREDEQLLTKTAEPKASGGEQPLPDDVSSEEKATTDETKPAAAEDTKRAREDEPQPGDGGAAAQPPEDSTGPTVDPLLREAEALKNELAAKLAMLDEAGVNHLHEGEPEARMMKGRGTHALGYNAQIVVDHDSDLIVASDVVTQQNDLAQLVPMLVQVRDTLGRVADQTAMDNGYANGEQLKGAEERAMNAIVALRDEPDAKGEYSKAYFQYDAESNVYVCPKGERLAQIGTNKSHATTQHPDAIYRCLNKTCPVRAACTKDPLGRKIRRPHGEDARERQAKKQEDPRMRVLLSLRKEIVEHLFGIVKAVDGFRRFTVRGLEKARAQWALVCTAVNLRKLYAWWRQGRLILSSPTTPTPGPSAAATTT
jgi:transposase